MPKLSQVYLGLPSGLVQPLSHLKFFPRTHLIKEGFLDSESVSRGKNRYSARHGWVSLFLLQTICHNQEGSQSNGHALRGQDDLDLTPNRQQVKYNLPHGKVQPLLQQEGIHSWLLILTSFTTLLQYSTWALLSPNHYYRFYITSTSALKQSATTYLCNKLDDLDKDIEWGISGHNSFGTLREERIDDACQARVSGRVALTLDADHVHPQQPIKGL